MESLVVASERLPYPLSLQPPKRRGAGSLRPSTTTRPKSPFAVPDDFDALQSEYIRLFEVGGRGGAPCPLYAGHYARDRLRSLETLVRFYNFFGLQTEGSLMPDHVSVQLEFMAYLAAQAADAETPNDRNSFLRAQSDFLAHHLCNWWPRLEARLKDQQPLPFYRSLAGLTSRFLAADLRYVG